MTDRPSTENETVWISTATPLPDVCCNCGFFTDRRVSIKHIDYVPVMGSKSTSLWALILHLILHLALGPIGWIVSLLATEDDDKNGTRIVKQKSKLKLPQCRLCQAKGPPQIVESRLNQLSLQVHERFKQRLAELQLEQPHFID